MSRLDDAQREFSTEVEGRGLPLPFPRRLPTGVRLGSITPAVTTEERTIAVVFARH